MNSNLNKTPFYAPFAIQGQLDNNENKDVQNERYDLQSKIGGQPVANRRAAGSSFVMKEQVSQ